MIIAITLVLLLLSEVADAATKYVGAAATGSGNGSSTANLCGGLADVDCTPAAGDIIYICGVFNNQISPQAVNGSSGNNIIYDFNCPGNPGSLVFNASADQGIYINGRQFITVIDAEASGPTGTGGGETGLLVVNASSNISLVSPSTHDNTEAGAVRGHGTRIKASTNVTITNPESYNNVGHGLIILNNGSNITVTGTNFGCKLYNNRRGGVRVEGATAYANLDGVIIDGCVTYGNGDGLYSIIAQNITFRNNIVYDNNNTLNVTSEGYGIGVQQTLNMVVERNEVFNNRTDGIEVWGNSTLSSNNCRVVGNVVHGHNTWTLDDSGANGIEERTGFAQGCLISGNLVYNNTRNFRLGNDPGGTSILANNTVIGGSYSVRAIDSLEVGTNAMTGWNIVNNIFYNPTISWFFTEVTSGNSNTFAKNLWFGNGITATYNNVSYNSGTISTVDSTALTSDPLFTSAFKLDKGSPARKAGVNWSMCRDLRKRICNSPPDLGAYQVTSGELANSRQNRQ